MLRPGELEHLPATGFNDFLNEGEVILSFCCKGGTRHSRYGLTDLNRLRIKGSIGGTFEGQCARYFATII